LVAETFLNNTFFQRSPSVMSFMGYAIEQMLVGVLQQQSFKSYEKQTHTSASMFLTVLKKQCSSSG